MYTKRIFPLRGMLVWTKKYILIFLLISVVPVFLFDVLNWKWLHLPWLPIGLLGTAVAFIAGFKNNASYDKLWEARKIWGGIVNSSRSWTIMIKDFITNDHAKSKLSESELRTVHKELVYRHVAWMTALRYQLRQPKPWEEYLNKKRENVKFKNRLFQIPEHTMSLEDALDLYITKEEKAIILAKGNRPSQLLGIQSKRLRELYQAGLIEDFRHMEMKNMLVEFYTLQGKSERIKNFPYPRQFATLNFLFVWIFIILLPFGVMNEFESIGGGFIEDLKRHALEQHDQHTGFFHALPHFLGMHFVWLSVPFSALISWVFYCIELIGENTENPFQGGVNDVPISSMSRGIEIDIRQLIDDTDIPKPLVWENDIVL